MDIEIEYERTEAFVSIEPVPKEFIEPDEQTFPPSMSKAASTAAF